jgi:UDP-GlcNAc:undecaprenyl-phosphate GlcNAc-1-phosphate transferase
MFIIFLIVNLSLIFCIINFSSIISQKLRIIDYPKKEKIHKKKTPLLGGIFLITGVLSNLFYLKIVNQNYNLLIFLFVFSFFFLGLLDDIYNIKPTKKLFISGFLFLILIFLDADFKITNLNSFYSSSIHFPKNTFIQIILTVLCSLLLLNAFNMSDGINGLASSLGLSWMSYILIKNNNILELNNFVIIIIYILIFLYFNLKGKFFLGDSGNFIISTLIITLIIKNNYQRPNLFYIEEIFLLFLLPGIDMLRLFILRILNKKSPFLRDKNHFHHILLKKYNLITTNFIYLSLTNVPIYLFYLFKINIGILILITIIIYASLIKKNNLF